MQPISITFDTNTFRKLVGPHKRQGAEENAAFEKIESAIKNALIQPYISDAIIIIEGKPRKERATYYKNILMTMQSAPVIKKTTDDLTINQVNITIQPNYRHKIPTPKPLAEAVQRGIELGFKFLHVPRIMQSKVDASLYKAETAVELEERLKRAGVIMQALEEKGFGAAHVRKLSKKVIADNPKIMKGEMIAFGQGDPKPIPDAIAEWADGDVISAHYAYGHDYFCTLDEGKKAGKTSVLHSEHRSWLLEKFGIKIIKPLELMELLNQY